MSPPSVKRAYDAPARRAAAAATRERICATAEELFLRNGYARTSIRTVAKAAGVSEATVYLVFQDKAGLLGEVIVRATHDNTSESLDAILAAPPAEILPRFASSNATLMARAGRLIALGESAARMDAQLRPLRDEALARLRGAFRTIAERLGEAGALRVSACDAADTLYAIACETTYLRMTEDVGLSPERYADWLAETLAATLLADASRG
jgi:AcrR family transcriptional regulator